ncbi:hypothetical protein C1646_721043 [Rhizophagus diaphanus]|nr:hypothetical protein C1646_721043 [Rhizophagus diaphanus] [Rhizophagus sp. MUCL 43196]
MKRMLYIIVITSVHHLVIVICIYTIVLKLDWDFLVKKVLMKNKLEKLKNYVL